MFSTEILQYHLKTEFLGHEINYKPETNSTNTDAWKYINDGCETGAVFITDNQQIGRGRRQNKWFSSPGKSLTFSFILFPQTELDKLGILPLLTGVSIVQGIRSFTSIQTGLKWPNDIMLHQKKIGGILTESKSNSNGLAVVVGIGLNINETDTDIPDCLKDHATSLTIHSGEQYIREQILSVILSEFETLYTDSWGSIIPKWQKYCIHTDTEISFNSENGKHKGIFKGISSNGHAEIQINGESKIFSAGMVTI